MEVKAKRIINLDEGVMLDVSKIMSFSIRKIEVDETGNMAYAVVGYPNAGAGFIVGKYNKEKDAKDAFKALVEHVDSVEVINICNYFKQPAKKEPTRIKLTKEDIDKELKQASATEEKGE